jgi:hypothetical protein
MAIRCLLVCVASIGSLLTLTTCTPRVPAALESEEPLAFEREPPGPASTDPGFNVEAALVGAEHTLLAMDWARRTGGYDQLANDMHTHLPDEGVRSLYYYASEHDVTVQVVGGLFGTPVFREGPHGKTLDFMAVSFGEYNPEFVDRLREAAQALAHDPARIERTRDAFDRLLRRQALTYLLVYDALHRDPVWYGEFKQSYEDYLRTGRRSGRFDETITTLEIVFEGSGYSLYETDTAVYFWVRRDIDDTDLLWLEAIEALLTAYGVDTRAEVPYRPRR